MRLQEKVKGEGVRHPRVDDSTRRQIASTVHVGLVDGEEAHIMALGTDHEGHLGAVLGVDGAGGAKDGVVFLPIGQFYPISYLEWSG